MERDSLPTDSHAQLKPISEQQRYIVLDILRGFALCGILFMNIEWFNRPMADFGDLDSSQRGWHHSADWLVSFAVEGKFYTLFALLFGMGFAIMWQQARHKGNQAVAWFIRRLAVLFVFGLLHLSLLWSGDILNTYALGGFMLIGLVLAYERGNLQAFNHTAAQLKLAMLWLLIPVALTVVVGAVVSARQDQQDIQSHWQYQQTLDARAQLLISGAKALPIDTASTDLSELQALEQAAVEVADEHQQNLSTSMAEQLVLTTGSFWQATQHRLTYIPLALGMSFALCLFVIVPLFLIGYALVRGEIIQQYQHYLAYWRVLTLAGLGLGSSLAVPALLLASHPAAQIDPGLNFTAQGMNYLSQYLMSAGYLGGMLWLLCQAKWLARLSGLAAMGRMALSLYLMQSLMLSLIFFGYGLGWYGQIDRAWQLLMAVVILLLQCGFSRWWLKHFHFGPLEWVWRCLTYMAWQPFRR